jgi:hypothetical protein
MTGAREWFKRTLPEPAREWIISTRRKLAAPPLEDIVLHGYEVGLDQSPAPRLTLVMPSISPKSAFGGVTTGLDIFLDIGRRTGADLRVIVDDFRAADDLSMLHGRAARRGLDPGSIEVVPRQVQTPAIGVRRQEVFFAFNWWVALNIQSILRAQAQGFGAPPAPFVYLIQDYEPHFYPFSSTHMLARLALEPAGPYWGIFNTTQLHRYFERQGHQVQRAFVFEPRLTEALRPALEGPPPVKEKSILVYGRPSVERNCFPAVEKGLRLWAERYPQFQDFQVVSAGLPHPPLTFAPGRSLRSLGKLSLHDYAELLRRTAVGLSLMASPHPSYPPLEMAHFGVRTVTNRYADKDLSTAHENIVSIPDIDAATVAEGLAQACRAFVAAPEDGWRAKSFMPGYLSKEPDPFLDAVAAAIQALWRELAAPADARPKVAAK